MKIQPTSPPQEKLFNDYMVKGNDFLKIQIYHFARTWFQRALELNVNNDLANEKLNICIDKKKTERLIVSAIVVVAAIVVGIICLINCC